MSSTSAADCHQPDYPKSSNPFARAGAALGALAGGGLWLLGWLFFTDNL